MSAVMLRRVAALIEAATRHDGFLGKASRYHLETGGSMWRAKLGLVCCGRLGVGDAGALAIAAACELIHQASIVHDDVQDQASVRRGKTSVGAQYGAPVAICVGDHLLMCAFRVLADAPDAAALARLFADRVCDMAGGQAEEFSPTLWSTMTRCRYLGLVKAKAGAMFSLPVEAAATLGGLDASEIHTAGQFARTMGAAYQLTDDIADVAADWKRGALNGVLVLAICSADPQPADSLRQDLTHVMQQGVAIHDETALLASLRPAAEAARTWRDRLLAEATQKLDAHPLRQVLLTAAAAIASPTLALPQASHHAA